MAAPSGEILKDRNEWMEGDPRTLLVGQGWKTARWGQWTVVGRGDRDRIAGLSDFWMG